MNAEDLGQISFSTVKDWRAEAALVIAEAHKLGWPKMIDKTAKAVAKHKTAITKKRRQIDQLSRLDILAGKRRKLLREIMQTETRLTASSHLQKRVSVLRPVFDQ